MAVTIQKRAYEDRLFDVDVEPAMRRNDSIESGSADVDVLNRTGASDTDEVTVGALVTITGHVITFMLSGGDAETRYTVRIRWQTSGSPTQNLEALVNLEVS